MIRELVLSHIHGEGWTIMVQSGVSYSSIVQIASYGPTKNKPTKSRLRQLQFRHFCGHKCEVVEEELCP